MKKIVFILIIFPLQLLAQFSITPIVGLNSTRMSQAYGYVNGGNYPVFGAEVEFLHRHNKYSKVNWSLVSGVNYLANGFENVDNYSFVYIDPNTGTEYNNYKSKSTSIQSKYWQVPAIIRINFRPFPLLEDWRLFFGAGLVSNYLIQAHMAEQWTNIVKPIYSSHYPGLYPPPIINHMEDSRDVTSYAVKNSLFERFEFGIKFRHFQICYRYSISMQDMYFKGIENVWNVPAAYSQYISAHNDRGITKIKYSELVLGWRLP